MTLWILEFTPQIVVCSCVEKCWF